MKKAIALFVLLFSYCMGVTVSGIVWSDNNGNGILDEDEQGISGIKLSATFIGVLYVPTITDPNGYYNLTVPSNTPFRVQFELPAQGWKFSPSFVTADPTRASTVTSLKTGTTGLLQAQSISPYTNVNSGMIPAPCVECASQPPVQGCTACGRTTQNTISSTFQPSF